MSVLAKNVNIVATTEPNNCRIPHESASLMGYVSSAQKLYETPIIGS